MDKLKMDTDALCLTGSALFRRRDKMARDLAEIDRNIGRLRNAYRDRIRCVGLSDEHFRQACRARGLLV